MTLLKQLVGCMAFVLAAAGTTHAQKLAKTGEYQADQVIVRIENASAEELAFIEHQVGARGHQRLFANDLWLVELPEGSDVTESARLLAGMPFVVYAVPNSIVHAVGTPNDTDFASQWGFNQANDADIDAPEAWDLQTDASSVVVAVIDTGTQWDHPDLAANIWTNTGEIPGNGIDDDHNGYVDDVHGYDWVNNDGNP